MVYEEICKFFGESYIFRVGMILKVVEKIVFGYVKLYVE